jgi:hypothetical protein
MISARRCAKPWEAPEAPVEVPAGLEEAAVGVADSTEVAVKERGAELAAGLTIIPS